jgi:hypothetical protein
MNQMNSAGTGRLPAILLSLLLLLAGGDVQARDVYKAYLDPAIPRHQAILDTLGRLVESPMDAGLKNDLGCLLAQEGFWRDALREFDESAKLDPKDSHPYFNAGLVRAMKSDWRGARGYFHKAVKRDPGNWPAWWMLGYAEEQIGNTSAAVDAYRTSVRLDMSLFDVTVNPYAAWTKLKPQVFLESYDTRRVRVTLPSMEQMSDPERVASSFQKVKRAAPQAAAPSPVPTIEAKSGPVIVPVPSAAVHPSSASDPSSPNWNPEARPFRRREETRRAEETAPAGPAAGAPAGEKPPADGAVPAAPGVGGPGIGAFAPGGFAPPPVPTPVPVPK